MTTLPPRKDKPTVPSIQQSKTAPTQRRGRGRPIGGSLPLAPPIPPPSSNLSALVAAAETITSEKSYISFLKGDASRRENKGVNFNATNHNATGAAGRAVATTASQWTHPALQDDTSLDSEYAKFVRSLVDDDRSLFTFQTLPTLKADLPSPRNDVVGTIVGDDIAYNVLEMEDGDDEDYMLTSDEEEEEYDDDSKKKYESPQFKDEDLDFEQHLFGEIDALLEEDLDAQLTSLLQTEVVSRKEPVLAVAGTEQQKAITSPGQSTKKKKSTQTVVTTPPLWSPEATNATTAATVTKRQLERLRQTMARHHQLLLQQATLSVRAAYVQKITREGSMRPSNSFKNTGLPTSMLNSRQLTFCAPVGRECGYENDFWQGEGAEELAECLDGAVGMLQDLEQNWKDAVRNSIQLSYRGNAPGQQGGRRNLMSAITQKTDVPEAEMDLLNHSQESHNSSDRRLTRSAFTKTLMEREKMDGESSMLNTVRHRVSVFDVRGLARLRETFSAIDNSVKEVRMEEMKDGNGCGINILRPADHGDACELLLRHAGAEVDETLVPGKTDLAELLTHAPEAFAEPDKVNSTLTKMQRLELRKNKNQFTSGEDNLILRGVNLYGEKEWVLVSDRFLPDRSANSISQRYHRLSFLIYKSNGIFIDDDGKLAPLPTFKKGCVISEDQASRRIQEAIVKIKPPEAPTTMNVHRWTMEEDIAILKAVPMMGNQWAEICNHIIPHRDRGHIRKRYQVLERRIPKGITKMNLKRPATSELGKEVAKYAKTAIMPKTQKLPVSQKKVAPKKTTGVLTKPRAKNTKAQLTTSKGTTSLLEPKISPPVSMFQPFASKPTSSFEVTIDEDDEKGAALLHRLSTPQRPQQELRPLSQDRDAAKDLEYILNGQESSNAGGETTRMGLEKILADDWSQESGMQRILDARLADESKPNYSPIKSNHLPDISMADADSSRLSMINEFNAADDNNKDNANTNLGARRSLLSNAIQKTQENASKRKINEAPAEPVKVSGSPVKVNLGSYVSSLPAHSPTQSPSHDNIFCEPFTLAAAYGHLTPRMIGTPGKVDTPGIECDKSQLNDEAFRYFMSDGSPLKSMTPSKFLPPNTPLNELGLNGGGISGPVTDVGNSLFMAGEDFDCVSALQDLSNSAPPTPSKLLLPTRISGGVAEKDPKDHKEEGPPKPKTSFLSKVKAQVGASQRKP